LSGELPLNVQFNDTSSGIPTTWSWNFGDGQTSLDQNPVHTFETAASYTVTLTVTNNKGTNTLVKTNFITVTGPPDPIPGWAYQKSHTIVGSSSGSLSDFPVRIRVWRTNGVDLGENVYVSTKVNPNYSDLRFRSSDNTPLSYWIENSDENSAYVWVKIPSIPTTGTRLYIYYGNPSAVSETNGQNVFDMFDDFESGVVTGWTVDSGSQLTIDSSNAYSGLYGGRYNHRSTNGHAGATKSFTPRANVVFEYAIKTPTTTDAYRYANVLSGRPATYTGTWVAFLTNGNIGYSDGTAHNLQPYTANTWYKIKIVAKNTGQYDIYINDVLAQTNAVTFKGPTGSFATYDNAAVHGYQAGSVTYVDNLFARQYAENEPSHGGWGNEQ
jgi:PKD repeat protein